MELSTIILLCLIAFLAGYVDAVVGGGGLIQVPAGLILMPTQAVSTIIGTLKVPSFIGTCFATYQYLQRVKIPLLRILLFTSIAFAAAFSGSLLLTRMSSQFMKPVIFFVLLVMAIYTFTKKDLGQSLQKDHIKYATLKGILICLIIGFYDGFIGPGGGSLFVLAFISILGYDFILNDIELDNVYMKDFKQCFEQSFSEESINIIKMITASLFFTLMPLHTEDQDKFAKYFKIIENLLV
jgi:uncharacterized membrane protein YfcA